MVLILDVFFGLVHALLFAFCVLTCILWWAERLAKTRKAGYSRKSRRKV